MPEPGIPQKFPNHMFTRAQLRQVVGPDEPLYHLLEGAAFESVYTLHDDFDLGLSDKTWVSKGFEWQEDAFFGSIANVHTEEEGVETEPPSTDAYLFSKVRGWRSGRRAVVMSRFTVSGTEAGKIELGFASQIPAGSLGIAPSQALPNNVGVNDYGFVLHNPADSTSQIYAIGRGGAANSGTATAGTPSIPIRTSPVNPRSWTSDSEYTNSMVVALNEQNEVKVYVNGNFVVTGAVGPRDKVDLGLWVYAGSSRTTGAPILQIDYIHAWQERITL